MPSSPKSLTVTPLNEASVPGSSASGSSIPVISICTPGPGIEVIPDTVSLLPTGITSANPAPVIVIVLEVFLYPAPLFIKSGCARTPLPILLSLAAPNVILGSV